MTSVYVPNGRALDHEHYRYKLGWLARLRAHVDATAEPADDVVVTGDFNIAPADIDVYDPAEVRRRDPHQPARARRARRAVRLGARGPLPPASPAPTACTRGGTTGPATSTRAEGLRIDLVLGQRSVAERCTFAVIDRNARKGQQPSDHAPVIVDLEDR